MTDRERLGRIFAMADRIIKEENDKLRQQIQEMAYEMFLLYMSLQVTTIAYTNLRKRITKIAK